MDVARKTGQLTAEMEATLNEAFKDTDGNFDEEAFANAFGEAFRGAFAAQEQAKLERMVESKGVLGKAKQVLRVIADTFAQLVQLASVWRQEQEAKPKSTGTILGDFLQAEGGMRNGEGGASRATAQQEGAEGAKYHIPGVAKSTVDAMEGLANGEQSITLHRGEEEISYDLGVSGKKGMGLLHIVEQRMVKDGAPLDDAIEVAIRVAESASSGEEVAARLNTKHYDKNGVRAIVAYDKTKNPIITGYLIKDGKGKSAERKVDALRRSPNAAPQPHVSSEEVVAALKEKIAQLRSEVQAQKYQELLKDRFSEEAYLERVRLGHWRRVREILKNYAWLRFKFDGKQDEITKDNFFKSTEANFTRVERPERKPDYTSYSKYWAKSGRVSSEYWYTDEGVIRGSDHWGKFIASCDWYLDGEDGLFPDFQYGFAKWDDFTDKMAREKAFNKAFEKEPTVVYDDNEEVVPPSKRFSGPMRGVRYHLSGQGVAEEEAVRRAYTNPDGSMKEGWMRAPNGEPTKLTERQWLQVRTPSFKRWFGDWELKYEKFDVTPIPNAPFNNTSDALNWAEANGVIGQMSNEETGGKGEINISKGSVREMLNPSQREKSVSEEVHFAVLTKLREVIRTSLVVESHPDYKKGADGLRSPDNGINADVMIDVIYGAIERDGVPYRVKTTLKKYADKKTNAKAYAYDVSKIEVLAGNLVNPQTNPNTSTSIDGDILLKGVKNSKGELALDNHSKVVDENGEPMVVYHTTNNAFTVFKKGVTAGLSGKGIYFAVPGQGVPYYGKRRIDAFLNIRNPMTKANAPYEANRGGQDAVVGDVYERFPQFDGIMVWRDEITVNNPTQIKSATDNVGTFDEGSPDIRYHLSGASDEVAFSESAEGKRVVAECLDYLFTNKPKMVTGAPHKDRQMDVLGGVEALERVFTEQGYGAWLDVVGTVFELCERFQLVGDGKQAVLSERVRAALPKYLQNLVANRATVLGRRAYLAGRNFAWSEARRASKEAELRAKLEVRELKAVLRATERDALYEYEKNEKLTNKAKGKQEKIDGLRAQLKSAEGKLERREQLAAELKWKYSEARFIQQYLVQREKAIANRRLDALRKQWADDRDKRASEAAEKRRVANEMGVTLEALLAIC